jgi:hypothetical protein
VGAGNLLGHVGQPAGGFGSEEEVNCHELEIVGANESSNQTKVTDSHPP